jgi:hypothetical protein
MRYSMLALLMLGCAAPSSTPEELAPESLPPPAGRTVPLTLDDGAFPATASHPNALWYLPPAFDATPPVDVIVYVHGFYNCISNVIANSNSACSAHGPTRNAYALAAQLDASGRNVALLLPEVAYDQASSDPGALGQDGAFATLFGEALATLPDGALTTNDVGNLIVASHSGGYRVAADVAQRGGVTVGEIWLLDSLYGNTADFDAWMQSDLQSFSDGTRRFANIYTTYAGTLANSQAMGRRAAGWLPASALVDDHTLSTWPESTYMHGALFKHSGLAHDGVPRYYFGKLVATSSLLR